MPKITKRVVDALQPSPDAEVLVWDSELKGFGVRMMPSGVASYLLKYRNKEGRQRKLTIGRVGTLTTEEARNVARQRIAEVTQGADPSADRHRLRTAITVAELCDRYLDDAKAWVKPTTLANDKSRIERHVKPLIGRHAVISLTLDDITKLQADIAAGRTAAPRDGVGGATTGGKGIAARTVNMFGTILEYARKRKIVKENVARGVKLLPSNKQQRFLRAEEISRLGIAMREAEEEGELATPIAAVRFLLLSGCRRMEALTLKMLFLDRGAGCIWLQDTKAGPQVRPIGAAAFDVLEQTPHRYDWVFPGARGKKHFVGLPKVLERLCRRAKLEGVTIHVLRHSFASMAAEMGYSELTIAGLLGHAVRGVTARYTHLPDSALVSAADRVSAKIAAALAGEIEKGRVVQFPERRVEG